MPLTIVWILTSLLIISLSAWMILAILNIKSTKKDLEEIEKLREFNMHLDKALDGFKELVELRTKKQNTRKSEVKKKKSHKQKLQGGFMNKYNNKLESLSKQLGDSYKLSLNYGKKGSINLIVDYLGNVYKVKFNSRKFNETPNSTIINKIKNEIKKIQGGNNNE